MEVKINKEIRNYSESIFLGLSMRQCFFSLIACIVAAVVYFSTINTFGTEVTSWLCMLSAAPFAALGFITFQEMNAEQIVRCAWRSFLLHKQTLVDRPFNLYLLMCKEVIKRDKKEALKRNDKKLFKIQKTKQ